MGLLVPVVALGAFDSGAGFGDSMTNAEGISGDAGLTNKSFTQIITSIINWVMTILAVLAVLMFIIAGVMYVTAQGDEEVIKKAKKLITYAIMGVVIALIGFLLVQTIQALVVGE